MGNALSLRRVPDVVFDGYMDWVCDKAKISAEHNLFCVTTYYDAESDVVVSVKDFATRNCYVEEEMFRRYEFAKMQEME